MSACTCSLCGTCKPAAMAAMRASGLPVVFVSDGTSDRHAARVADVLFAKEPLASWCRQEGVVHYPVTDLGGELRLLLGDGE